MRPEVITCADDFGLSAGVNEGVERAHRHGILTSASLMVAGPAAADAVRRAKALPGLRVGLHLVLVEGTASLPSALPGLVDSAGRFGSGQAQLGFAYGWPGRWRGLEAEVQAQFRAFAATGLALDHANAHKHMHLHPVVGALLVRVGREHGLRAMRVPAEPPSVMRALGEPQGLGARAMHAGTRVLRRQGKRAGLRMPDQVFGLAWSGRMTADRLRRLAPVLPPGLTELYFHPAAERDAHVAALMPGYEHEAELAALCDPAVRRALAGVTLTTYG